MSVHIPTDLIETYRKANRVVVLTGAGISAESGVPTFREAQTGLWAQYDPRELATPQAFARNPRLVWEWYAWRRSLIQKARPNLAHYALVDLEQATPHFLLVTQNIDGFHWIAGSRDMVELHGNIARTKCFDEGHAVAWWPEGDEVPPRCPKCGGLLRPDVVWFGEMPYEMDRIYSALRSADLFVSIGTSGAVYPAAGFVRDARALGLRTLELNLERSQGSAWFDESRLGPAGELVPAWVEEALASQ